MNIEVKERFIKAWEKYFPGCELPIACFYSNEINNVEFPSAPKTIRKDLICVFDQIAPVRKGRALAFNKDNLECSGSFLPLGFNSEPAENLESYICNIKRVKKRYKHSESMYEYRSPKQALGEYLVFKRWDTLDESDDPYVVFFFGNVDVIIGLHGLANFESTMPYEVITSFGTGCDSIVGFPMHELESDQPKAILGIQNPSARLGCKSQFVTFSTPWPKFLSMLENIDESFLATDNWSKVKSRFL